MKKLHSKWWYISCGMNAELAILGALTHNLFFLAAGFVATVIYWIVAENKAKEEKTKDNQ